MGSRFRKGWLQVYAGGMGSGKTSGAFGELTRHELAGRRTLLFKSSLDTREPDGAVTPRGGTARYGIVVASPTDMLPHVAAARPDLVAVEEAQFFDSVFVSGHDRDGECFDRSLLSVVRSLTEDGIDVVCTGLNQDFRGEPLLLTAALMAMADEVHVPRAVCSRCRSMSATRSQRNDQMGRPVPYDEAGYLPGGADEYAPRCIDCHDVPGAPWSSGGAKG